MVWPNAKMAKLRQGQNIWLNFYNLRVDGMSSQPLVLLKEPS